MPITIWILKKIKPQLFLFLCLPIFYVQAAPKIADRYVGVLRHEGLKRDQLAKLDFIFSVEEKGTVMRAILTLHLGGFNSKEYVAYDFTNVEYHPLEKGFVFSQKEHGVRFITREFSPTEITAEFSSPHSGNIGTLHLRSDKPVAPELPLLEPLWGEYRGQCASTFNKGTKAETVVQVYTYRSSVENTEISQNAFRAYDVKGFIGEDYHRRCPLSSTDSKMCLVANIDAGTYNFFENRFNIYCNVRDMSCIPEKGGLSCERCEFLKRVSSAPTEPIALIPQVVKSAFQPSPNDGEFSRKEDAASLAGLYRGYVHHESLDVYQPVQFKIATYETGPKEDPQTRMLADATLYFGDLGSAESIAYHFAERPYPKSTVTQFVFDSPDPASNIDAIVQVNTIGSGVIKGVWFSRIFGRVGNFELSKEAPPGLPANAQKMGLVSGNYDSIGSWDFDILIKQGSAQSTSQNPFSPLTFAGYQYFKGTGKRDKLIGGSYDFYTGRIALVGKDEAGERLHIGERLSRQKIKMKSFMREYLTPIEPFDLLPYKLVGSRN